MSCSAKRRACRASKERYQKRKHILFIGPVSDNLVPRAFITLFQLAERKRLAACGDEIDVGGKKDNWDRKEAVSGE